MPYLNTFAQKYLDIPIKGVSRGLGGKGGLRVLHYFLRIIGGHARFLLSLSLKIINLNFGFGVFLSIALKCSCARQK